MQVKEKYMGIAQAVLIALVILAGAIAVPILFRPFFYLHIKPLDLPAQTGLTVMEIKTAYGQMLDYCIGASDTFSVGVLPFSESGAAHFADVRRLFALDLWVLAISAVLLGASYFFKKRPRLGGHTPGFWSTVGLGAILAMVGGLAALDFDRAFTVFHKLCFPGKDNWIFRRYKDPVIDMLPEEFFRNCAIVIFALIALSCTGLILWDKKKKQGGGRLPFVGEGQCPS